MTTPAWLAPGLLEAVHLEQLAEHGGAAGIRDAKLLETALAKPLQLAAYGDPPPDLCALAAAYGHGIAHLHPFVDGNKRTSLVATLLFLRLNGLDITATPAERYAAWIALAAGDLDADALAAWLRACIKPLEQAMKTARRFATLSLLAAPACALLHPTTPSSPASRRCAARRSPAACSSTRLRPPAPTPSHRARS